jgi:hypothetical protein
MPPKKESQKSNPPKKKKKTTKQKTDINFNQLFISDKLEKAPKLFQKELLCDEDPNKTKIIDVDYMDKMRQKNNVLYYKTLFKKLFKITKERIDSVQISHE